MLSCVGLTYTQGGWGAVPNGENPGAYLHANFDSVFGSIQIGDQSSGAATSDNMAGSWAAQFTSAQAITDWLPHGGPSGALGGDTVDPSAPADPDDGTLAGQTLALALNVGFDAADPNFDGDLDNAALGDYTVVSGDFAGKTVSEVLAICNRILSGDNSDGFTANQATAVADAINKEYDNGVENTETDFALDCGADPAPALITGIKFQDHNANGVKDGTTDQVLSGWQIYLDGNDNDALDWIDADADNAWDAGEGEEWTLTDVNGFYSFLVEGDATYIVREVGQVGWVPTLGEDGHTIAAADGGAYNDNNFGNTNVGAENGKTLGFWSNKNGQALITQTDITALNALHLRNANGTDADFTGSLATAKSQLKSWLLNASATNMASMLSAQLAATVLDSLHGFFGASTAIYIDGLLTTWSGNSQGANLATNLDHDGDTDNADADGLVNQYGFASISALIAAADAELALHSTALSADSWRAYQEALKIAFDGMNNNLAIFAL